MGVCASSAKTPNKPSERVPIHPTLSTHSANSKPQQQPQEAERQSSAVQEKQQAQAPDVKLPARVFKGDKEVPLLLQVTESGQLRVKAAGSVEESKAGFAKLLGVLEESGAAHEFDNLKALESLELEVRYPQTSPFIAKLVVKPLFINDLVDGTPGKTYIKLACEGDRSRAIYTQADEDGVGQLAFADTAAVVFIVLHSAAVLLVKIRDNRSSAYLGQASIPVASLEQGTAVQDIILHDTRDKSRVVCTIQAEVTYEWMRGTKDEGGYNASSKLTLNRRKLRKAAMSPLEYISQVNHWLLSHDNVWPSTLAAAEPQEGEDGEVSEDPPSTSGAPGQKSALLAKSSSLHMSPAERWEHAVATQHHTTDDARQAASNSHHEQVLMDALGKKDSDTPEMTALKQDMLALMLSYHERTKHLEQMQVKQSAAISELFKPGSYANAKEAQVNRGGSSASDSTAPFISGHFEYGLGRAAGQRHVFLFIGKSQDHNTLEQDTNVTFLGIYKTNRAGVLKNIPVPAEVLANPGHYSVVGLLPDDHTFAKGSLFILKRGTQGVVFDMDGTLTVGDLEVVTMFAIDSATFSTSVAQNLTHKYDLKQRKGALHCVRAWAAKGYQPIYLSGRQGSYFNLTQEWLVRHKYPPGPIHLTRTHLPTLPIYYSVGNFKVDYMGLLQSRGLDLYAAYGNTPTDIRAYVAHGIAKERIYIIGPHGGKAGSQAITNFTEHNHSIFDHPDATTPIPYTELMITAVPCYRAKKVTDAEDGMTVTTSGELEAPSDDDAVSESAEIQDDDEDEDAAAEKQSKVAGPLKGEDVSNSGKP